MDQCMVGQRNAHGELVKKATSLRANHELLLQPFRGLQCSGDHDHGSLLGGLAASTQAWTWDFCSRVASGIVKLKRLYEPQSSGAYPTTAVGTDASVGAGPADSSAVGQGAPVHPAARASADAPHAQPSSGSSEPGWRKCPACLQGRSGC